MELNANFTWKDIEGFFGSSYIYDTVIRQCSQFDTIAEIGCYSGKSTAYLISRAKIAKKHPNVLCIEKSIKKNEKIINNLTKAGVIDCVCTVKNHLPLHSIKDESIFALLIQDSSLINETISWKPKIKKGGIIAGCDIHNKFTYIEKTLNRMGIKKIEKHEEPECILWLTRV